MIVAVLSAWGGTKPGLQAVWHIFFGLSRFALLEAVFLGLSRFALLEAEFSRAYRPS
jgi:hypothetical protein